MAMPKRTCKRAKNGAWLCRNADGRVKFRTHKPTGWRTVRGNFSGTSGSNTASRSRSTTRRKGTSGSKTASRSRSASRRTGTGKMPAKSCKGVNGRILCKFASGKTKFSKSVPKGFSKLGGLQGTKTSTRRKGTSGRRKAMAAAGQRCTRFKSVFSPRLGRRVKRCANFAGRRRAS